MEDFTSLDAADLDLLASLESESSSSASGLPTTQLFNYSGMHSRFVADVCAAADRIRHRHGQIISHILATGQDLIDVKDKLSHGKFGPWLKSEFGWSEKTAQNFMNAAREFGGKPKAAAMLQPTLLYDLAAKGTPQTLRDEIITELDAGRAADGSDVRRRIKAAKTLKMANPSGKASMPVSAVEPSEEDASTSSGAPPHAVHEDLDENDGDLPAINRLQQARQAERFVQILQKRFGVKFGSFCVLMENLPVDLVMEALRDVSASNAYDSSASRTTTPGMGGSLITSRQPNVAAQSRIPK